MRCPTPPPALPEHLESDRLGDLLVRVRPQGARVTLLALGACVVLTPRLGWFLVPLAITAGLLQLLLQRRFLGGGSRWWLRTGWAVPPLAMGVASALTGGATSPVIWFTALSALTLGAGYRRREVEWGLAYLVALQAGAAAFAGSVPNDTDILLAAMVLTVSVGVVALVLGDSERRQRHSAAFDALTGLLDRTHLDVRLDEISGQALANDEPLSVIAGDIDHFKAINDEHGHQTGDDVLRSVAAVLRRGLRAFELVYRVGGEEFLVLLPGVPSEEAVEIAERLRREVAATGPAGLPVTMSFGVATMTPGDSPGTVEALLTAADGALYASKRQGRDRVTEAQTQAAAPALEQVL